MIVDFDDLAADPVSLLRPVLIVGSGPVGLALAEGLRRRGISTLTVESGGPVSTASSPFNLQESRGHPFTGVERRGRGLGGGTTQWAGQCIRFHEMDFASRSWIPDSGWPLSYDDLLPFYAEAEEYLAVSADEYHARTWHALGEEPGQLVDVDYPVRFSVYAPEPDLIRRDRARLTSDADRVLLYNATVTELLRSDDRVTGVKVRSLHGRTETLRADVVVLATGAIEVARLLLHPSDDFPQGVGTASGHVGRHFQDHPTGVIGEVVRSPSAVRFSEIPRWFAVRNHGSRRHLPRLVLSSQLQRRFEVLNACVLVGFEWSEDSLTENLRQLQRAFAGHRFDLSARSRFRRILSNPAELRRTVVARARGRSFSEQPSRVQLAVHLEQAPNNSSRVTLGDRRDPLGRRIAAVDWRVGEEERRAAIAVGQGARCYFERHRLGDVVLDPRLETSEWVNLVHDNQHHSGTARMASRERDGVVDVDGRVFGLRSLHVAGGATFPTSSYANPTLTMMATGFRLAAVLDRDRRLVG